MMMANLPPVMLSTLHDYGMLAPTLGIKRAEGVCGRISGEIRRVAEGGSAAEGATGGRVAAARGGRKLLEGSGSSGRVKLWWSVSGGPRGSGVTWNFGVNLVPLRFCTVQRGSAATGLVSLLKARTALGAVPAACEQVVGVGANTAGGSYGGSGSNSSSSSSIESSLSTSTKSSYEITTAEGSRTATTTYFHSYSFVPGGAVPLPAPLHTAGSGVSSHLLGQQTCNFACTCTCTCTASIVSAAAAAAANANAAVAVAAPQHPPPLHQHHRALGTATATVLLQPVDQIKDAMRGSDELLSQSGAVNNGASMSPQPHHAADNNNDAKKAKLDKSHNGKPSRVIHIRNIPSDVSEGEIIHLGLPFGRVTNVLVLKGKNQAFLEMSDESAASTMVTYYASSGAQLRNRAVYVQFSNHRELKTDQTHSNAVSSPTNIIVNPSNNTNAQAALQAAQGQSVQTQGAETQGGPNTVLRVIVEHMIYAISLDTLYQIFTRYGKVLKIVTFTKNNSFQALIQYPDMLSAQTAKFSLDGQNIYNSCCTLRIDYSKMQSLNVKYNNDKSRDYTNPTLPTGDANLDAASLALGGELLPQLLLGAAGSQPRARLPGAPGVLASPFAAMHGLPSPLAAPYNGVAAGGGLAGLGGFSLGAGALGVRVPGSPQISSVLLVTNLNEEMVTPDALFTLFGVYGDVQRVKILYNKKDSALIQMAEPHQGHLAMTHMDKLRVFGKQIRVMTSKHQTVQLPKEGQPDAGLTKDYTNSTLHRFKKPGSKNYQNIYPPSATLHLSNIPATVTEEEIKDAFTTNGFTVKAFKFFPKDRKMALIQMPSMDEAVTALIKMHNYQLSESNHLRVSFSKSNI